MIELHKDCKARLIEVLADRLGEAVVHHNCFLGSSIGYLYEAQESLPSRGAVRDQLNAYISENPLVDFVLSSLSQELLDSRDYEERPDEQPLSALAPYAETRATATRLIEQMCTLPWEYAFSLPAPGGSEWRLRDTIQLSNDVDLIAVDPAFRAAFPSTSGNARRDRRLRVGLIGSPLPNWEDGQIYLQIRKRGFVGYSTETAFAAAATLRAVVGLGIAVRLLEESLNLATLFVPASRIEHIVVHRKIGDLWVIEPLQRLDSSASVGLSKLALASRFVDIPTDEERIAAIDKRLGFLKAVLRNPSRAQNILLAAQWLFENHSGSDELLGFVQMTVVAEILLGDKRSSDLVGVTELLANRCAYLIADSAAERDLLIQDFRAIYTVRSAIVHSGKSRLNSQERRLLDRLRQICARIILKEMQLLDV